MALQPSYRELAEASNDLLRAMDHGSPYRIAKAKNFLNSVICKIDEISPSTITNKRRFLTDNEDDL